MRPIPILRGWNWSHLHPLTVKAGGATRVVYGGTGRPLIGKVVLSDSQRKIEWPGGHHSLTTRFAQPPPDQRTPEGWRAWQRTPEDKQALANHRTRAPTWQPDGSFRLDEVLPGRFQLSLRFTDPGERFPLNSIGSIGRGVEVPETPDGPTDEPPDPGEPRLALRSTSLPVRMPDNPSAECAPGVIARGVPGPAAPVRVSPAAPRCPAVRKNGRRSAPGLAADPAGKQDGFGEPKPTFPLAGGGTCAKLPVHSCA